MKVASGGMVDQYDIQLIKIVYGMVYMHACLVCILMGYESIGVHGRSFS
ncbi:hypothetical protein [Acinetobacter sp. FDAARGOS_495]|nr:hypothetical protein [Acinetobacter sp. FDAARGOS_495]